MGSDEDPVAGPRLTLRLRLVLALTALVVVGLSVFGVATYSLYARSERQRLDDQISPSHPHVFDDQISAAIPLVQGQLYQAAGLADGRRPDDGPGGADTRPKPST